MSLNFNIYSFFVKPKTKASRLPRFCRVIWHNFSHLGFEHYEIFYIWIHWVNKDFILRHIRIDCLCRLWIWKLYNCTLNSLSDKKNVLILGVNMNFNWSVSCRYSFASLYCIDVASTELNSYFQFQLKHPCMVEKTLAD